MLTLSIILFAIAAIFGLTLIVPLLQNKETPKISVVFHGIFAATALVLLIIFAINHTESLPVISIIIFVTAAIGGFILFTRDVVLKKPGPKALALIHASAAVIAFLIILIFALS